MDKFLYVTATIVVSVLASLAIFFFGESEGVFRPQMTEEKVAEIAESVVDSVSKPTFATVGDVIKYRDNLLDKANEDYVIMEMSSTALQTVTDVLLSRNIAVTPTTICREYYDHQEIYDKIPFGESARAADSIVVDTAFVRGYPEDTVKTTKMLNKLQKELP